MTPRHSGNRAIFVSCDVGQRIDKLVSEEQKRTGYKITIRGVVEKAIADFEKKKR